MSNSQIQGSGLMTEILKGLSKAREVVIFSGAGLSADSGIPTFRDGASGLWANVDPMEVASIDGFNRDPETVWRWHQEMRQLFACSQPNAGHEAMAKMEMLLQPAHVSIITQNIDGLHQDAGNTRVLEVHGSARRIRCHRHCGFVELWEIDQPVPHQCPICGAKARPDVVWFGEALNEEVFMAAERIASRADVFFAVGTSSVVQPAASLPMLAINHGAMVIEVNPFETPFSAHADYSIRAGASEFFPALCNGIGRRGWKRLLG
jgi:NAD-dependent deacetylase